MGNLYSAVKEDAKQFKELSQESEQNTPIVGSPSSANNEGGMKPRRLQEITGIEDPRSPSQGVSRTPLEVEEKNKRIERARLANQLNKENNLTVPVTTEISTPTGAPPGKILFDPRSPNPEISRTPIAANGNVPAARKMFQDQN